MMAVTRVSQCGFELQEHGVDGWSVGGSHTAAYYLYETSSPAANSGASCLNPTYEGSAYGHLSTPIPDSPIQVRLNFWLYMPAGIAMNASGLAFMLGNSPESSPLTNTVLALAISTTFMRIHRSTTVIETVGFTPIFDTWIPVGLDVYSHNSSGYARSWYNGVMVNDFSGDTLGTYDEINHFSISARGSSSWGLAAGGDFYVDDLTIEDTTGESVSATAPAMKKYHWVTPDGNGNYDDWVGSDSDSVDNYLHVDDIPPDNDTSYIEGGSADRDSFTMTAVSTGSETIDAVIPVIVAKTGGAAGTLQPFIREGAVDDDGAAATVGTAYDSMAHERFLLEPSGGAWDETQVNAMEIGVLVP